MSAEEKHRHHLSSEKKTEVVLRALRGESREALAEELKVPLDRIEGWESMFLDAGRKALSKRKGKSHRGKIGGRIAQWSLLLLVLLVVVYFLTRFMQSTGQ
jgi:hypothetical protein